MSDRADGAAPLGAEVGASGVAYRVWAPDRQQLAVLIQDKTAPRSLALCRDAEGYWSAFDYGGRAGDRYRFQLDGGLVLPDPRSRFQPAGVDGPSECIDPKAYRWGLPSWQRPAWRGQTIYELHLGAFTAAGTTRAAIEKLDHVRDLGAEGVELMPVADFSGQRNWGYDGVSLYAPARCYGRPDDLRALVDAAHERGLVVILDVVLNHLGPAGNYLREYCPDYFLTDSTNRWGPAFDLDGPRSPAVRAFLVGNAAYWLDEFRIDGLRLDATHAISDRSARHLVAEIAEVVHARGAFVIAEDERNESQILRTPEGTGFQLDAIWSDDFHHQVRVALTGIRDSYFSGYTGSAAALADSLEHGWTYRGQPFPFWAGRLRGTPSRHLPPSAFVFCIENHDQVGNRARGERLAHLIMPRQFRAASMLLCLCPYVPMIFMGQEWAASSPFLFFSDLPGEAGRQVAEGRRREFETTGLHHGSGQIPDPQAPSTFTASKLRWEESLVPPHGGILQLYRECLRERRAWFQGAALGRDRWDVHCAGNLIGIRYRAGDRDRMLLVTLHESGLPEGPLPDPFQPPLGRSWRFTLHSEEARFGGRCAPGEAAPEMLRGPIAVWMEAAEGEAAHGIT